MTDDDERRPGVVRVYGWDWGPEEERRPGVPWLGIFLVAFGALLVLERVFPAFHFAGSAFILAIGIAFLVRWLLYRGVGSLYAGAIIIGLALPGTLEGLGLLSGPGLGSFALGLAFLFIAGVRFVGSGGVGWQAWLGTILLVIGASQLAYPELRDLVIPALILVLGGVLLLRGAQRR